MDVERTIEFILHAQAKSEARMDKFDKRLEATRKLVETGMRMLVKIEKTQGELTVKLTDLTVQVSALTESQRNSDRKFERFMDSWTRQRTNGHPPKR
jgi:hypothetical protein